MLFLEVPGASRVKFRIGSWFSEAPEAGQSVHNRRFGCILRILYTAFFIGQVGLKYCLEVHILGEHNT